MEGNRAMVLDTGRITESGTHGKLTVAARPVCADLWWPGPFPADHLAEAVVAIGRQRAGVR